jgi:hypothetical protein
MHLATFHEGFRSFCKLAMHTCHASRYQRTVDNDTIQKKQTGLTRHRIIRLLHGHNDYTQSVVAEHGHYLRAAASLICTAHIGRCCPC